VVVGPATRAAFPIIPPGSTLVGARFVPGMAAGVLGAPAVALVDLDVPLADLWDRASLDGPCGFDDARSPADGLRAIQDLLIRRLGGLEEPVDPMVGAAAQTLARQPRTPLDALAAHVGLSERQLRRRFEAAIGYGPKTFQRIVRFQRWLRLATASPADERRLTDLAAAAGYADQAHLTREVTRLAGLPPTALLGSHEAAAP
jgi:AraC-like DNA-binding protein